MSRNRYSGNPEIAREVERRVAAGWRFERGGKHGILIAPNNRRVTVPVSSSCWRASRNFCADVRRLEAIEPSPPAPERNP